MVVKCLRRTFWTGCFLGSLLVWPLSHAQSATDSAAQKQVSPEQSAQMKEKLRSRWQAMTPQEREQAKIQLKQRFESLSPEQKQKLRESWQLRGANPATP